MVYFLKSRNDFVGGTLPDDVIKLGGAKILFDIQQERRFIMVNKFGDWTGALQFGDALLDCRTIVLPSQNRDIVETGHFQSPSPTHFRL